MPRVARAACSWAWASLADTSPAKPPAATIWKISLRFISIPFLLDSWTRRLLLYQLACYPN